MNTATPPDETAAARSAKVLYTAKAHGTAIREGGASPHVRWPPGCLSFPSYGGPGSGTNPEQLLAVGWSACFTSAIKIVAARMKVKLPPEPALDSEVGLCTNEGGYFLRVRFSVSLPGLDGPVAQSILDGAHHICPYSKATRET